MTTRKMIVAIWNELERLADKTSKDVRFAYGISKNRSAIKAEIDAITKMQEPSEDYKKFNQERTDLCKNYGKRNPETGEFLTYNDGMQYAIDPAKQVEFDAAAEKLKKKYAKEIKAYDATLAEVDAFLEGTLPVPRWHSIALDMFPDDTTARTLEVLDAIVLPPGEERPGRRR